MIIDKSVKWIYHSPIGEIELWAESLEKVLALLANYGFNAVDIRLLKEAETSPQDVDPIK